jgi:hypothetical protein
MWALYRFGRDAECFLDQNEFDDGCTLFAEKLNGPFRAELMLGFAFPGLRPGLTESTLQVNNTQAARGVVECTKPRAAIDLLG